jgi:hypothetical protein
MMGNGVMYSNITPPNPLSNIIGIGNVGYNNVNMGGYYTGAYNGYYNPYLAAKQQEIQLAQQKELERKNSDMLKRISRNVNKALHSDIEDMDQYLKQYDPVYPGQDDNSEDSITHKLLNLHYNGSYVDMSAVQLVQYHNQMFDQAKKEFPDDMSMYEFHEKASELYLQARIVRQKDTQKDISKLYNSSEYNQLINMHGKGSANYFDSVFKGGASQQETNIDDMEIKLPNHLCNQFEERKRMFIESIMKKG